MAEAELMQPQPLSFKEAFCDHFKVAPENFNRAALFMTLHSKAGFLFRILYAMRSVTAQESILFIEKVGATRTDEELEDIISEFHNDMADMSTFLARRLNQRVSARKVAWVNHVVRGRAAAAEPQATDFYRRGERKG